MTHIRTAPTESNLKQADDAGMLVQAAYRIGVSASHRTAHQGQAITPARRILISGSLLRTTFRGVWAWCSQNAITCRASLAPTCRLP